MKRHLLLFSVLALGAMALGFLSMAKAAEADTPLLSASQTQLPQAVQNPVKGKVLRLPKQPSSVGFEQNTLGIAVKATRTVVQGQVQTEFHLQNIPALPGRRYAPQALSHVMFVLNGLPVELSPRNNWMVAYPGNLLERSNAISLDIYGAGGVLLSSLSNRIGL